MRIVLGGERPMSWNKYIYGKHWSYRSAEAERVQQLVKYQVYKHGITDVLGYYTRPVHVTITVFFDKRPYDACNIPAKLYIDGIKGIIVADDTPKYIGAVTTIPMIDKDNPRVIIEIEEIL